MNVNDFSFQEAIEQAVPDMPVKYGVPWRELSTLGAGNDCAVVAEPLNEAMLLQLLKFTSSNHIRVLVIGNGSNIVGSDQAVNALVVRLVQNDFVLLSYQDNLVTAGGGVRFFDLVNGAARHNLGGLAPLVGIPGYVGGFLRMNAGANGIAIGNFVQAVHGVRLDGTPWNADGREIKWSYRSTDIPADVIITRATLKLNFSEKAQEMALVSKERCRRVAREPKGRSAGCAFRNVSPSESAGRLIDECKLKSWACGGAVVSEEHANYIINRNYATEQNICALMSEIRRRVAAKFGFYLKPEVCFINQESLMSIESSPVVPVVALLKGGNSSEREVSLRSGAAVGEALERAGYKVIQIDVQECRLNGAVRQADVVFPVLHGGFGENGEIQLLLEEAGKKFVGSGSRASRLVMDKISSKHLADELGVNTAKWAVVSKDNPEIPAGLKFPLIVKAPKEGSTIGIFKINDASEWGKTLCKAFEYDEQLLVEECIVGSEVTVPIVLDQALPVVEIVSPHGFYDYDAKYVYSSGKTQYYCPPRHISDEIIAKLQADALKFYQTAGCRDLLRVDFMIDAAGNTYFLEGNSLPGFTATSLVPKSAHVSGMSFERLCAGLVQAALRRK